MKARIYALECGLEAGRLNRTFLGKGCKADVLALRKQTATSSQLSVAFISLANLHDGVIGIAEALETTAVASLVSDVPVVFACCADALSMFHWPPSTERLIIFANNDNAGEKAAATLAKRSGKQELQSTSLRQVLQPSIGTMSGKSVGM